MHKPGAWLNKAGALIQTWNWTTRHLQSTQYVKACARTLLTGCEDWLDHTYKTEGDSEVDSSYLSYNAYIQLTKAGMYVWNQINLRCTPQVCQHLKKKFEGKLMLIPFRSFFVTGLRRAHLEDLSFQQNFISSNYLLLKSSFKLNRFENGRKNLIHILIWFSSLS